MRLSYRLCYHRHMAQRTKRSVSLSPDLAEAIERSASEQGMTFSGWLADVATRQVRLDAGRLGIAEWEREHGPLTAEELADGLARARAVLGRSRARRPSRRSA